MFSRNLSELCLFDCSFTGLSCFWFKFQSLMHAICTIKHDYVLGIHLIIFYRICAVAWDVSFGCAL